MVQRILSRHSPNNDEGNIAWNMTRNSVNFVQLMEFSLNVFTEFVEYSDKNICLYSKRARTCHQTTSCVKDQDATSVSARYMWKTGSLNWAHFMLPWFIWFPEFVEFTEFLFHLGKTAISVNFPIHLFTKVACC